MIEIFIGSSTEAKERGIVPKLVRELGTDSAFVVQPWYDFFDQGRFILESLLTRSKDVDAAVLIFTKDDTREYRGSTDKVARDNVVLEAGLFLSQLGRERVWILAENGSVLPVDFSGLIVSWFGSNSNTTEAVLNADLSLASKAIKEKWRNLSPIQQDLDREEQDDCGIGIKAATKSYANRLMGISTSLKNFSRNLDIKTRDPIYFDSTSASREAYAEALSLVKNRFMTTTYISSGFWTKEDVDIVGANSRMLARLKHNQGYARRLFLLIEPPQAAASLWRQELIDLRNQNNEYEIQKRRGEFDTIKRGVYRMIDEGTEVRVVYENPNQRFIPPMIARQIGFDYRDSEIAIYDDFRVDIFGGGSIGHITDVRIFSKAIHNFD